METLIISVANTVCNNQTLSELTIYIQDVTPLSVTAGPDQSTACGGSGGNTLTGIPTGGVAPYTYNWGPTGGSTQSITVTPTVSTIYTINVTDVCGKQATDDVEVLVEQPTPLTLTASNDTVICQNTTAILVANPQGGNGQVVLEWSTGQQNSSIAVTPVATTTYSVTATDACNQTLTEDVVVTVEPNNALFDYFFITNNNVTFNNQSIGYDALVAWDFGDSTVSNTFAPTHTYGAPGTYVVSLVVENSAGCLDTFRLSLNVRPEFNLYIPNAFSPNQDGINESFNAQGQGFDVYKMNIYNRWGQLIFTTNSLTKGWYGTYKDNGQIVPNDMYVYEVRIRITPDKDEIVYRGKVLVTR